MVAHDAMVVIFLFVFVVGVFLFFLRSSLSLLVSELAALPYVHSLWPRSQVLLICGQRMNCWSYEDLGEKAFGAFGRRLVELCVILLELGSLVVSMVSFANSCNKYGVYLLWLSSYRV